MSLYMVQVAYTPEAWGTQIQSPQDRLEAIRPSVEKLGGRVQGGWYSFGEYDIVALLEMPDNVSAAAFAVAAAAGGALKAIKTTPLMTIQEGMEALRKAAGAGYRPPSR